MSDATNNGASDRCDWDALGSDLVETIRRYHANVRDDVEQMRELIDDAIGRLVAAYHVLQAQAKIGYEVMRGPLDDDDDLEEEDASAGVGQVGTSAALTALQFEDVLTQLLSRLRERCDRYRPLPTKLVDTLLRFVQEVPPLEDDTARLEDLRAELVQVRDSVERTGDRTIGQRSMDPGSVELF